MTGHVKWTDLPFPNRADWEMIKAATQARTTEITRAWVQGYILALEDVIKDIEVQRNEYLNDPDAQLLTDVIWGKVQESLASAEQTLDTLNEIMEEEAT